MKSIIMILTNGFEPDVRVYKEAKYLVEHNCSVTILCWDRDCNDKLLLKEDVSGIQIIRYRIKSEYGTRWRQMGAYLKFVKCCRKYIRKHQHDYIHCHDIDGALIGFLIKKHKDSLIFDMHEFYEHGNFLVRYFWRKITIFLLHQSIAGLYVTSVYLSDDYKNVRSKLYELRNYPDSTMIQPLPKTPSSYFRVGYHGVVRNQIKEFSALFEAVNEMSNVRVDINGGGTDLKQLLELQDSYENVYVHGPYDGIHESSNLYANTDLLFCAYDPADPNYQGDTEVIKFYEAIFTGTPILVTSGIGMENKVVSNRFGLSCDTRNSEEIRNRINLVATNKELWKEFHENEISCSQNYSWEKTVETLSKIYGL